MNTLFLLLNQKLTPNRQVKVLLLLAKPELILKLQIWSQKVIMDADYKPGIRTKIMFRIMGIIFIVFGLIALFIAIFQK
jgi:uncharacterized membrane protein